MYSLQKTLHFIYSIIYYSIVQFSTEFHKYLPNCSISTTHHEFTHFQSSLDFVFSWYWRYGGLGLPAIQAKEGRIRASHQASCGIWRQRFQNSSFEFIQRRQTSRSVKIRSLYLFIDQFIFYRIFSLNTKSSSTIKWLLYFSVSIMIENMIFIKVCIPSWKSQTKNVEFLFF